MVAIRGRFDGQVFVPDEFVDLPRDQRVILHVEPIGPDAPSTCVAAAELRKLVGSISLDDLRLMSQAIERDCERVDENEW